MFDLMSGLAELVRGGFNKITIFGRDMAQDRDSGAMCEVCGKYPLIFLNGQRLLCWDHYVQEMRKEP